MVPHAPSLSPADPTIETPGWDAVLDGLQIGCCLLDNDLRILGWNETLVRWTGFARAAVLGRLIGDVFPHVLQPRLYTRLRNALQGQVAISLPVSSDEYFLPIPSRSGPVDSWMIQETHIRPYGPERRHLSILIRDVSIEQAHLYALRNERSSVVALRRQLQQQSLPSVTSVELSHDSTELTTLRQTIQDLASSDQRLRSELSMLTHEQQTLLRQIESLKRLQIQKVNENSVLTQMVQELRVARDDAQVANAAKSRFLAAISHDIRTPLSAILGYVHCLRDLVPDDDQIRETVATIERNTDSLLELINDVLDLAKIESGRLELEAIPVTTDDLVQDVLTLFSRAACDKGLELQSQLASDRPTAILSDPVRLRQIVCNLVGNAVKFTAQGKITVELGWTSETDSQGHLLLAVQDTGRGISPEQMTRLFQPFLQAETQTTRQYGGTGLGLVISRNLARALGGDLTVTSQLNAGSRFELLIPAKVAQVPTRAAAVPNLTDDWDDALAESRRSDESVSANLSERYDTSAADGTTQLAESPPSASTADSLAGRRLLVADDAVDLRRLMSFYLNKSQAMVDAVENGRQVIDALLESRDSGQSYDAILLDMQMPVLDGYDTARRIRELGFSLPVIALTAYAMQGDRERCLTAGCDDYLSKPVTRPALLAKLQSLFARQSDLSSQATAEGSSEAEHAALP